MNRQAPQRYQNSNNGLPFPIGADGQYLLYYSNYSDHCKEFINILCKTPYYQQFTKINVSSNVSYPSFIKNVPTIIVPKINRPLVGEEVFQWIEDQSVERSKNKEQGIIPYSPGEMSYDFGDSYSYLDVKDTEQPMEHSFSFVKREDQRIETPEESSFVNTNPEPIKDVSRQPFPQAPQQQHPGGQQIRQNPGGYQGISQRMSQPSNTGSKPPMIPVSSDGDSKNVEDAYNELLARRKMDIPVQQQPM